MIEIANGNAKELKVIEIFKVRWIEYNNYTGVKKQEKLAIRKFMKN